jgi:threonine/homoserine/homoserine lactone efflux protein
MSAEAFTAIKWLGAAYLLWLALGIWRTAWRGATAAAALPGGATQRGFWADFRIGLFTNVLNPKVALFSIAFIPQFIAPGAAHKTLAFLLLGAWLVVQSLPFLLAVVALTMRLRRLPSSPGAARWLNAAGGGLFALLAVRLASARPASA